jgi:hypothetical protein
MSKWEAIEAEVPGYTKRTTVGSLQAYLLGKQSLAWVLGMIGRYEVRGPDLEEIFQELRDVGTTERWLAAYNQCQGRGWL